jgi:hypothetical protein
MGPAHRRRERGLEFRFRYQGQPLRAGGELLVDPGVRQGGGLGEIGSRSELIFAGRPAGANPTVAFCAVSNSPRRRSLRVRISVASISRADLGHVADVLDLCRTIGPAFDLSRSS